MSVANLDKMLGKYMVAIAEAKENGKFEFGVLCQGLDGQPSELPNVNEPIGFSSTDSAQKFIDDSGCVSDEKTSILVIQIASVK